jgi:phospholipase A-2-activating protein
MSKPYSLAFTLNGHSSDVRNLCAPHPSIPLLLSASRDGSGILWGPSTSGGREWDVKMRAEELEKRFVSCVGMVRSEGEGRWAIRYCRILFDVDADFAAYMLMGSSSGILSTFQLPSATSYQPPSIDSMPQPYHTLIEHKQNLCCMDVSKNGLIATGSWDKWVL